MRQFHVVISVSFWLLWTFHSGYGQLNPDHVPKFFAEDTVPRLDIIIDPDSLEILLEDISTDHEYPATFIYNDFNGTHDTIEQVGFRIRGNYSRVVEKKSFKISINSFFKGRKYLGLEKINLKATLDDSFVRPKLSWHLCQQMGITSTWVNHVMLYINNELWGIYTNVEHVDEEFIKKEFGNDNGNLYKCRYPASLERIGNNPDDYKWESIYFEDRSIRVYELKTNTDEDDYTDLMELTHDISATGRDDYQHYISSKININSLLKFFALEVYLGHWDSYSFMGNNFYLYHNSATNKFEYITYDMDLTMGMSSIEADIINQGIYNFTTSFEERPLRTNILEVPAFRDIYTFYMKQLITKFPPDTLREYARQIQEFIAPFVQQDPFYAHSMEDFYAALDTSLDASVYGIIEYFDLRYQSILEQLDESNTAPIISDVNYSSYGVEDTIIIRCTVEDDDPNPSVIFHYQMNNNEMKTSAMQLVSQRPLMGVHEYEVKINPMGKPGAIRFNIGATDAEGQESLMPLSGFYNASIYGENTKLRINELMASNTLCMTDEYGERDDWVEIYNADTVPIGLGNKYMSDAYTNTDEWKLPDTIIQPGDAIWFWADNQTAQGEHHANFRLSRDGETAYLFEKRGEDFHLLDSMSFPEQESNISYGNIDDVPSNIGILHYVTPGYPNGTRNLTYLTVDVDMNNMINNHKFNPEKDILDVVGNFNDWEGSTRFYDYNDDGIYSLTIYNLLAGDNIQYRLRINQDDEQIEYSNLEGAEGHRTYILDEGCNRLYLQFTEKATDIPEFLSENDISIYPNPAKDHLHLTFTDNIRSVQVMDINGNIIKQVDTQGKSGLTIDIQNIPAGMYLIQFVSNNKSVFTEKIVKY